jgi:hypothetical protein
VAAAEGVAMTTALETYREAIAGQPPLAHPQFGEWLGRYRAGDEAAGRAITGSCLGVALAIVEGLPAVPAGLTAIEAVEEANAGLAAALDSFAGATADEFLAHARRAIHAWLHDLNAEQD